MRLAVVLAVVWLAGSGCTDERLKPIEKGPVKDDKEEAQRRKALRERRQPPKEARETVDGYEVIRAKTRDGEEAAIQVKAPKGWRVIQPPTEPDPHGGTFTLEEALAGLKKKEAGALVAEIKTSMGTLHCDLFEERTPNTVANFVGLARGKRKFWDGKQRAWTARKHYDGTLFHRVIPGFMIQGGDITGTGKGRLFYSIPDELHPELKHDRAGQLCMANRGPNTNEGQFFITDAAAPHLDGSYTIFGQCQPTDVVFRIARVPQAGPPTNSPLTPVVIEHVGVSRVAGGAKAASTAPGPRQEASADKPTGTDGVPRGKAVRVHE